MANLYPGWMPYPYPPYYSFPPTPGNARREWQAGGRSPGHANVPLPPFPPGRDYPLYPYEPFPRGRRRSFDASYLHPNQWPHWNPQPPPPNPPPSPYHTSPYSWMFHPPPLPQPQIHTLFNGDSPSQYLLFDLSAHTLTARRRINATQAVAVTPYDLEQPASNPEITRLLIVCDAIPQWKLDLHVTSAGLQPARRERPAIPFITVGDVLYGLHVHFHTPVTHEEWGQLSSSQETDVSRAYTKRYKAYPPLQQQQQREGVKRVDFLLRDHYFKGLVWASPENGVERMKLLVGSSF